MGGGRAAKPEAIVAVKPGERTMLYQGILSPGNFARVLLRWLTGGLVGSYLLKATFCFLPQVTTSFDPAGYSLSALDIKLIPDCQAEPAADGSPRFKLFFDLDGGELDLGHDAKDILWANTKSNMCEINPGDLVEPAFEIRFVDRQGDLSPGPVEFSLVVTVIAPEEELTALDSRSGKAH